jgi:hypothetical protein
MDERARPLPAFINEKDRQVAEMHLAVFFMFGGNFTLL